MGLPGNFHKRKIHQVFGAREKAGETGIFRSDEDFHIEALKHKVHLKKIGEGEGTCAVE